MTWSHISLWMKVLCGSTIWPGLNLPRWHDAQNIAKPDQIKTLVKKLGLREKLDRRFSMSSFSRGSSFFTSVLIWSGFAIFMSFGTFTNILGSTRRVRRMEKKNIFFWGFEHMTLLLTIWESTVELHVLILRSQVKLRTCEKVGSYETLRHVFFIVQFFLDSQFL